jgi:hypothetical protein
MLRLPCSFPCYFAMFVELYRYLDVLLQISQRNVFEENGYYTWMYSGNMVWSNIATAFVIAVVIICTLMPIWPVAAKKVLWYCSVTFLIVIFVLLMMRALSFLFMWFLGYEFWVFPRLFDETLSFQDSFVPVYSLEKGSPGQGLYRLGALALLGGFVYWACTQPTEFDGFVKAQKDFIDDLYSGNLLSDVAHQPAAHLDRNKRVPSLEDLLKAMEADEKEKIGDSDEADAADLRAQQQEEMANGGGSRGTEGEFIKFGADGISSESGGANGEDSEDWSPPDYSDEEDMDVAQKETQAEAEASAEAAAGKSEKQELSFDEMEEEL